MPSVRGRRLGKTLGQLRQAQNLYGFYAADSFYAKEIFSCPSVDIENAAFTEIRMKKLLCQFQRICSFCSCSQHNCQQFSICKIFRPVLFTFFVGPLITVHFFDCFSCIHAASYRCDATNTMIYFITE